jgi:SCP-2 sterol transfer family
VLIQFDFRGAPQPSYWLLIERKDISVCLKHPDFDVDVILTADIKRFYEIWLGRLSLMEAMRKSHISLDGSPADIRGFPTWFTMSPMAETVRASLANRKISTSAMMKSSTDRLAS